MSIPESQPDSWAVNFDPTLATANIDVESWRRNLLDRPCPCQDAISVALDEIERLQNDRN